VNVTNNLAFANPPRLMCGRPAGLALSPSVVVCCLEGFARRRHYRRNGFPDSARRVGQRFARCFTFCPQSFNLDGVNNAIYERAKLCVFLNGIFTIHPKSDFSSNNDYPNIHSLIISVFDSRGILSIDCNES
jgi:hypothetical protein